MTLNRVWVLCGGYKRDTQNDIEESMGAVWGQYERYKMFVVELL